MSGLSDPLAEVDSLRCKNPETQFLHSTGEPGCVRSAEHTENKVNTTVFSKRVKCWGF